jgi:hypothetical protein
LVKALAQAVNDNAEGKLTIFSALILASGILRFARPRNYLKYISLAFKSRGAPWRKALFLDLFLNDLHQRLRGRHKPDFSMLFLNAGAHIQHHYMLNSQNIEGSASPNPEWYVAAHEDPMAEMLVVYDYIIREYLRNSESSLILATGLRQVPYPHPTFYYRLRDHKKFLKTFGIVPIAIQPRMTRDFLVKFEDAKAAKRAQQILASIITSTDGVHLFEEIENRGHSLFVTLTYPKEILDNTMAVGAERHVDLKSQTVFVAIKNGMHDAQGYIYCKGEVSSYAPENGANVKHLYSTVMNFFENT